MKSNKKSLFNIKKIGWQWLELWGRKKLPVSDYWVLKIMMLYYYIKDNFYKAWGINSDFKWLVINYFYKLVNDDKDWVIVVSFLICQD